MLQIPEFRRDALLHGDDEIAAILRHHAEIAAFVATDRDRQPRLHRAITAQESPR